MTRPVKPAAGAAPREPLGRQINVAAHATRSFLDAALAEAGLSFANWSVLAAVSEAGPLIQRELAQRLGMIGPSLVLRIDQLEALGFVRRVPVPGDRRASRVEPTAEGLTQFDAVATVMRATEAALTDGLDPADVDAARRVLSHVATRARQLRAGQNA